MAEGTETPAPIPAKKTRPEPGDVGYTEGGRVCELVARHGGEYIVRPLYDHDGEGEPCEPSYGAPIAVREFWLDEQPNPRLAAAVVELEERIRGLRETRDQLAAEIRDSLAAVKSRVETIKRHEKLRRLEDFLEGRITHVVTENYAGVAILPLAEAIAPGEYEARNYWDKPLKLLTLYGASNGDISWGINHYSDGSGSSTNAYPFTSYEEARAKLVELISAKWSTFVPDRPWESENAVKNAQKYDVPIPEHILAAMNAYRVKAREDAVAKQEAELAKAQAALAEVKPS